MLCQLVPDLEDDVLLAFTEELAREGHGRATLAEIRKLLQRIASAKQSASVQASLRIDSQVGLQASTPLLLLGEVLLPT